MKSKLMMYTGERMIPGETPDTFFFEHLRRYYFIKDICRNKHVLDVGCGNGYGSKFLADYAKSITAIDIDEDAVENAKHAYKKNNLKFLFADVSSKELNGRKFNVISSFEVIEHIKNKKKFISDIKKLLKPSGILVISTPNRLLVSPNSKKPSNPFHVKEFDYAEFKNFLGKNFKDIELYGQSTENKFGKAIDFMRYIRYNKYFFYASVILLNIFKIAVRGTKIWAYQKDIKKSVKILEKNMHIYKISKKNPEVNTNFIGVCKNPF